MLKISKRELLQQAPASDDTTNATAAGSGSKSKSNPAQMHGSLLIQSILQLPEKSSSFVNTRLVISITV